MDGRITGAVYRKTGPQTGKRQDHGAVHRTITNHTQYITIIAIKAIIGRKTVGIYQYLIQVIIHPVFEPEQGYNARRSDQYLICFSNFKITYRSDAHQLQKVMHPLPETLLLSSIQLLVEQYLFKQYLMQLFLVRDLLRFLLLAPPVHYIQPRKGDYSNDQYNDLIFLHRLSIR
ncbi:hypothetical protein D3C72_535020 [compost metagenome]